VVPGRSGWTEEAHRKREEKKRMHGGEILLVSCLRKCHRKEGYITVGGRKFLGPKGTLSVGALEAAQEEGFRVMTDIGGKTFTPSSEKKKNV